METIRELTTKVKTDLFNYIKEEDHTIFNILEASENVLFVVDDNLQCKHVIFSIGHDFLSKNYPTLYRDNYDVRINTFAKSIEGIRDSKKECSIVCPIDLLDAVEFFWKDYYEEHVNKEEEE